MTAELFFQICGLIGCTAIAVSFVAASVLASVARYHERRAPRVPIEEAMRDWETKYGRE